MERKSSNFYAHAIEDKLFLSSSSFYLLTVGDDKKGSFLRSLLDNAWMLVLHISLGYLHNVEMKEVKQTNNNNGFLSRGVVLLNMLLSLIIKIAQYECLKLLSLNV
jgi:hypothetical protein